MTGEPGIRFYAGAPLVLRTGIRLGTLCIIDTKPRSFSEVQRTQLEDLARIIVAHVELHRKQLAIQAALEERNRTQVDIIKARKALEETTDLLRLAQEAAGAGIWHWSLAEDVVRNSPVSALMLGFAVEPGAADWIDISTADWEARVHPDDLAMVRRSTQPRAK